ncbi:hypothetical protein [Streptomyces sp. NPDC090025]|uniref:hypothetical protein n=1 Tax=Streptomyces sp. NPDC090025 TaxID=3365922 RepID=UPI003836E188
MSFGEEHDGQTRTRLPDPTPGTPRPTGRGSRSLLAVLGVVALLIAAIALANRGGDPTDPPTAGSPQATGPASAAPTNPTGVAPVTGKNGAIAAGFARDEQGAQSAAANYAVALVSADILKPDRRGDIVRGVFAEDKAAEMESRLNEAYSKEFLDKLGLDAQGNAAAGMTYVSRTAPVGTKVTRFDQNTATVEVWCTGVFGTAGVGSKNPVTNDWFTMTLALRWTGGDWKLDSFAQKEGPAPVNGDRVASDADVISKAVQEFGGFTYAR